MKKPIYKVVANPLEGYNFSFARCHTAEIGAYIIGVGIEAQECFAQEIRKIEKEFKVPRTAARDKLREDIDRLLMQSKNLDELLEKLKRNATPLRPEIYCSLSGKRNTVYPFEISGRTVQ